MVAGMRTSYLFFPSACKGGSKPPPYELTNNPSQTERFRKTIIIKKSRAISMQHAQTPVKRSIFDRFVGRGLAPASSVRFCRILCNPSHAITNGTFPE